MTPETTFKQWQVLHIMGFLNKKKLKKLILRSCNSMWLLDLLKKNKIKNNQWFISIRKLLFSFVHILLVLLMITGAMTYCIFHNSLVITGWMQLTDKNTYQEWFIVSNSHNLQIVPLQTWGEQANATLHYGTISSFKIWIHYVYSKIQKQVGLHWNNVIIKYNTLYSFQ